MPFNPGDRVTVKPEVADKYIQPWRDRIRRGMHGTYMRESSWNGQCVVQMDMPKRAKYPDEWLWRNVYISDLMREGAS